MLLSALPPLPQSQSAHKQAKEKMKTEADQLCVFIYRTSNPICLLQHYQNNENEGPARMMSARKALKCANQTHLHACCSLKSTLQNTSTETL